MSDTICETQAITCFTETAGISTRPAPIVNNYMLNESFDDSIRAFLARPQILQSVSWITTQPVDTTLASIVPSDTITTPGLAWYDKVRGFGLMRGTFVLRIELNANPFQLGSLLVNYVPCPAVFTDDIFTRSSSNYVQWFQNPHVHFTTDDTAVEIEVPFIAPDDYFKLEGTNESDWGTIALRVVTPLRIGTGTQNSVDLKLYGYWKDVVFSAPMVAQSNKGLSISSKELAQSGSKISDSLFKVSTGLSGLSSIPYIGQFTAPLSWATRTTGMVASAFGYSKPPNDVSPMIASVVSDRYIATSEGTDCSLPISTIMDNSTIQCTTHSSTPHDEMSLSYLLQKIPNIVSRTEWYAEMISGYPLLSREIGPVHLYGHTTVSTGTTTVNTSRCGGPLYYLGNVFSMYRGSIILNLKFIKTKFHSGKLMITFTPYSDSGYVAPNLSTSVLSIRQIVDIRESDEITLTLPYLMSSRYMDTCRYKSSLNGAMPVRSSIGRLEINVLNQLKSPDTASPTIDIIESYTAGDDFEFACPTTPQYFNDESGILSVNGAFGYPYVAQSNTGIVDSIIGDLSVPHSSMVPSESCVGERVLSLKQLMNRVSFGMYGNNFPNSKAVEVNQFYIGMASNNSTTGAITRGGPLLDTFSLFAPMYLFMKGSVRIFGVNPVSTQALLSATVTPVTVKTAKPFLTPSRILNGIGQMSTVTGSYNNVSGINSTAFSFPGNLTAHFRVPYMSKFPITPVQIDYTSSGSVPSDFDPSVSVTIASPTVFSTAFNVGRSAGEDFQLLHFISCPRILVRSVPV